MSINHREGESKSFVDRAQAPFLDFLRSRGQGITVEAMNQLQAQQGQMRETSMGFLNQLQNNPFMQNLQGMSQPNPGLVSQQVDQLGADIGRNLQQNILPGIQSTATGLGSSGGSRQGVAEGIAAQAATDALQRGATQLTAADQASARQAAIAGSGLQMQQAMGGLQMGGQAFTQPYANMFAPLMMQGQLVGPTNVLNKSREHGGGGGFVFGSG